MDRGRCQFNQLKIDYLSSREPAEMLHHASGRGIGRGACASVQSVPVLDGFRDARRGELTEPHSEDRALLWMRYLESWCNCQTGPVCHRGDARWADCRVTVRARRSGENRQRYGIRE